MNEKINKLEKFIKHSNEEIKKKKKKDKEIQNLLQIQEDLNRGNNILERHVRKTGQAVYKQKTYLWKEHVRLLTKIEQRTDQGQLLQKFQISKANKKYKLKDTRVFINKDFSRATLDISKELWEKRCTKNEDFLCWM